MYIQTWHNLLVRGSIARFLIRPHALILSSSFRHLLRSQTRAQGQAMAERARDITTRDVQIRAMILGPEVLDSGEELHEQDCLAPRARRREAMAKTSLRYWSLQAEQSGMGQ